MFYVRGTHKAWCVSPLIRFIMENNGLRQHDKNGLPKFITILLLGSEILWIVWVAIILVHCAPQFMPIFSGLGISLPFITIALVQYWYLWIILLSSILVAGVLLEIFIKGKWRWINIILSSFTIFLCCFIVAGFVFAVLLPIFTLQQQISK